MILDDTLLPEAANWRTAEELHILETSQGSWQATLKALAVDSIGCRMWEIATHRSGDEAIDLPAAAEALAARVSGLMEPLRFLEVDNDRGVALLRSQAPTTRKDQRYYTELLLHRDGGVELRRYQAATPAERRQQVPFAMTHEALAKLVQDLTS